MPLSDSPDSPSAAPENTIDPRRDEAHRWVASLAPQASFQLAPASADASFRRYFRAAFSDGSPSRIVMDAPPQHEDCRPFVKVAGLLADAGLNAPEVVAQDLERGFLLLGDLGTRTYLEELKEADAGRADTLFRDAIAALITWQASSRSGVLPPYDAALLRRELDLFPEWFLGRHLGLELDDGERTGLDAVFALLIASATGQPQVFVHRDFMPRNLMLSAPNPGILDFQDAVEGPISYDVISLFRDAFISWDEERTLDWTIRYWEGARRAGLPVREDFSDFWREAEWMGLQRHLKVLGIFCRLNYRDGKPNYLADLPRFLGYVRHVASRYASLGSLLRLLDRIESRTTVLGFTL
jgi:aminoglycoside/choline kinase family phosphotransferase